MKTKLLLSIAMLVISMMGYANEKNATIPLEKIQYALDHPGIMIAVDTMYRDISYWRKGLWIQSSHTINYITYANKEIIESYQIIKEAPDNISWTGIIVLVLTMLGVFYGFYARETWVYLFLQRIDPLIYIFCIGLFVCIFVFCVKSFISNYNYLFLLPILLIGLVGYLGSSFGRKKEKRLIAEEKIELQNIKNSKSGKQKLFLCF